MHSTSLPTLPRPSTVPQVASSLLIYVPRVSGIDRKIFPPESDESSWNEREYYHKYFLANSQLYKEVNEFRNLFRQHGGISLLINLQDGDSPSEAHDDRHFPSLGKHWDIVTELGPEVLDLMRAGNAERGRSFLEVGCSPGGFSSYLLIHAQGVCYGAGVTPDVRWDLSNAERHMANFDRKWHEQLLRGLHLGRSGRSRRFDLHHEDILSNTFNKLFTPSKTPNCFDLVVCSVFLDGLSDSVVLNASLMVSQLVIALRNLRNAGNLFLVMPIHPRVYNGAAILLLRRLFHDVTCVKVRPRRFGCHLFCLVCEQFALKRAQRYHIAQSLSLLLKGDPAKFEDGFLSLVSTAFAPTGSGHVAGPTPACFAEATSKTLDRLFEPLWRTQRIMLEEVLVAHNIVAARSKNRFGNAADSGKPIRNRDYAGW